MQLLKILCFLYVGGGLEHLNKLLRLSYVIENYFLNLSVNDSSCQPGVPI